MGEVDTLKEISGELAVIREALERAEISERMLTGIHRELQAERDQLRAEVERLRGEIGDWKDHLAIEVERSAAAESTAAGLRRALEEMIASAVPHPVEHPTMTAAWEVVHTALAATSDEHARRIKSEALEEVSKELRTAIDHVMCCYNDSDIGGLQLALAKIAQLEKDSEECLKCSYANVAGKKVVYQRCADCDAEADRLEATNG